MNSIDLSETLSQSHQMAPWVTGNNVSLTPVIFYKRVYSSQ